MLRIIRHHSTPPGRPRRRACSGAKTLRAGGRRASTQPPPGDLLCAVRNAASCHVIPGYFPNGLSFASGDAKGLYFPQTPCRNQSLKAPELPFNFARELTLTPVTAEPQCVGWHAPASQQAVITSASSHSSRSIAMRLLRGLRRYHSLCCVPWCSSSLSPLILTGPGPNRCPPSSRPLAITTQQKRDWRRQNGWIRHLHAESEES